MFVSEHSSCVGRRGDSSSGFTGQTCSRLALPFHLLLPGLLHNCTLILYMSLIIVALALGSII